MERGIFPNKAMQGSFLASTYDLFGKRGMIHEGDKHIYGQVDNVPTLLFFLINQLGCSW